MDAKIQLRFGKGSTITGKDQPREGEATNLM
jgi:hypothetical protein